MTPTVYLDVANASLFFAHQPIVRYEPFAHLGYVEARGNQVLEEGLPLSEHFAFLSYFKLEIFKEVLEEAE